MGFSKSSAKGKVHSNRNLPQERKEKSNNKLTPRKLEKGEIKKPRVCARKDIIKIRAEINEKETKEIIEKSNKTKNWFFGKINKIDKPLARLIKKKEREPNQQN